MHGLELVVILGLALLAGSVLARRLRLAPPIPLLAIGVLLGFVPALREVHLPPDAVLLLFLPALLYWESLTTSLRGIRRDLRGVLLLGTTLVIATAGVVATVAHAFGLGWGAAWVLGAAVAPTDATAVGVFARSLPRRNVTLLRAESLINDGTALVVFALAVGITVGEDHLTLPHVSWLFLLSYLGGAAAGALAAWLGYRIRRHVNEDPLLANLTIVLTAFGAFLLAELIEASGVLAVVVAGLTMSQAGPRLRGAATRRQAEYFWSLATFLLNGALFVLVGLQVQAAVHDLRGARLGYALAAVVIVSALVVGTRFAFLFTVPYLIRLLDRRPAQRRRRGSGRSRLVSALCGFRGAVSLAVALSVPKALDSGEPFPDRDMIIFVTTGVILVTLVVQGLLLPRVTRWARLPRDTSAAEERLLAETTAMRDAYRAIPAVAERLGVDPRVARRTRREYEIHLQVVRADGGEVEDADALRLDHDYTTLRLALLDHKRATVLRLRDQHEIDDAVLLQLQRRLDIEEVRLRPHDPLE
ncbi:Na+/H+ antiporter [Streptomyces sp. DSM 44915]|uniref:Na+/H+ antiporter n=1 Tax=Streptomyces chisholmiae TaxID=3075540 RepID=A0ABU2JNZ2_9ACTN|nr:Na+/H+ antiporter [Streptomyces sp. DSM 44915]MDT0266712.1 Na+/H+ antiporter [Streptomyces sp. DSM 44915]